MASRRRSGPAGRIRIGAVSVYKHRASWWLYYREGSVPRRQRIGPSLDEAKIAGAEVNAQLATGRRTAFSFEPITVDDLVARWLNHHEHVLRSSVATVRRYRTAVEHLRRYCRREGRQSPYAHEVDAEAFVQHLRRLQVSPNGHPHTPKRRLRDNKGLKFVLGACRSMFHYAAKGRCLPPYFENPFAALPIDGMAIEDSKKLSQNGFSR